jgi:hypothetical protein
MNGRINPRILIASVVGVLLVGTAFFFSPYHHPRSADPRLEVVAGPAPERNFIEITDKNGDGVADWRETIPAVPQLSDSDATSTASTTRTHTAEAAIGLLEHMMTENMNGAANPQLALARTTAYIQGLAMDDLYTAADIHTSGDNSTDAFRAYGNAVAQITFDNSVPAETKDEVTALQDAMESNDPSALEDLAVTEASYAGVVHDLVALTVPSSLSKQHLDLINTMNALAVDVDGFGQAFSDPLYALVRIKRYPDDVRGLYAAVSNLYLAIDAAGVTFTDADVASRFVRIE